MKFDDGSSNEFEARVVDDHFHSVLLKDEIRLRIHLHAHFEFVLKSGAAPAFDDDAQPRLVDLFQSPHARVRDDDGRFGLGRRERRSSQRLVKQVGGGLGGFQRGRGRSSITGRVVSVQREVIRR